MSKDEEVCEFCPRPAVIDDGMCGALICDGPECFDRAWDRAYGGTE